MVFEPIRKVLSFKYDDHPMSDSVYEFHARWIKWLHDFYLRVDHMGYMEEALQAARREPLILISNHSLTIEATLINYILFHEGAGHVSTLVFREAFKLPFVREFFRSCQCIPISVEAGVQALRDRHILLFPEGMDFLKGINDPEGMSEFHTGFLRMAAQHLKESRKKTVTVLPIAHVGIEKMLKFWVVKNELVMKTLIRPIVKYPFWVIPKLPFFLPSKVVLNWGRPIKLTREHLNSPRKIRQQARKFREIVLELRREARQRRDQSSWHLAPSLKAPKPFFP